MIKSWCTCAHFASIFKGNFECIYYTQTGFSVEEKTYGI